MAYTPPPGSQADFAVAGGDYYRQHDKLFFTLPAGSYTAPTGSGIPFIRHLPIDWVAPAGTAVNFAVPGIPYRPVARIRSGVTNAWSKSSPSLKTLVSPSPRTVIETTGREAIWRASRALNATDRMPWGALATLDFQRNSKWADAGKQTVAHQIAPWAKAQRADDLRSGSWPTFGVTVIGQSASRWVGAIPADVVKQNTWRGYLIALWQPVAYPRPMGHAADFSVIGGGIFAQLPAAGYVPPIGNALNFQFGAGSYTAPYMRIPGIADFMPPRGDVVNWVYNPPREIALDSFGIPRVGPSGIEPRYRSPWGASVARSRETIHPWLKYSRALNPGWGIIVPAGPSTPAPGESIIVPIQRAYIVINQTSLFRVSDMSPIPASGLNISFDCDSWLPQFSAAIPKSALAAIMPNPDPVEVEASINGVQFRFLVEKISRNRQFAQTGIGISGRGVACELDAPYAIASQHTNVIAMTAQQLIDAALTNSGYNQSWGITDWLVPAQALSLYGAPAQVASHVAEAAGAVLSADWLTRTLRMRPRYPVKPWDWAAATPDFVIPSDVAQTDALEWIDKPNYNLVYVAGQQAGVLCQVKIAGTAGDLPAPMITHPLIAHADAGRQRGISILGDTGRKAMIQISMPVLESTGVIDICKLIEFSDGQQTRRGIVRANNIAVNWPTVRQTLTVEASA